MKVRTDVVDTAEAAVGAYKLNEAERVLLIISLLESGFSWADSPQSAEYWTKVTDALEQVLAMYEERED